MIIRPATRQDSDNIHQLYLSAFSVEENAQVANVAVNLLHEVCDAPVLSLVAESNGAVIGHVAFSPIFFVDADGQTITKNNNRGYLLAPLAVHPEHQKRGIGTQLVEQGLKQLASLSQGSEVNVVLVYGDPDYYGRFGFSAEAAEAYHAPYLLEFPFGWQAKVLTDNGVANPPVGIRCVPALSDPALW